MWGTSEIGYHMERDSQSVSPFFIKRDCPSQKQHWNTVRHNLPCDTWKTHQQNTKTMSLLLRHCWGREEKTAYRKKKMDVFLWFGSSYIGQKAGKYEAVESLSLELNRYLSDRLSPFSADLVMFFLLLRLRFVNTTGYRPDCLFFFCISALQAVLPLLWQAETDFFF